MQEIERTMKIRLLLVQKLPGGESRHGQRFSPGVAREKQSVGGRTAVFEG